MVDSGLNVLNIGLYIRSKMNLGYQITKFVRSMVYDSKKKDKSWRSKMNCGYQITK